MGWYEKRRVKQNKYKARKKLDELMKHMDDDVEKVQSEAGSTIDKMLEYDSLFDLKVLVQASYFLAKKNVSGVNQRDIGKISDYNGEYYKNTWKNLIPVVKEIAYD